MPEANQSRQSTCASVPSRNAPTSLRWLDQFALHALQPANSPRHPTELPGWFASKAKIAHPPQYLLRRTGVPRTHAGGGRLRNLASHRVRRTETSSQSRSAVPGVKVPANQTRSPAFSLSRVAAPIPNAQPLPVPKGATLASKNSLAASFSRLNIREAGIKS